MGMKPEVVEILESKGISYRLLHLTGPAYTIDDVARFSNVKMSEICKTILLVGRNSGEPLLVGVPGDRRIDLKKVGAIVKDRLRFAEPEEIEEFTGYKVGALPFWGHKRPIRTIIDQLLLSQSKVNFGTGVHNLGVEIEARDLQRLITYETGEISV